MGKSYTTGYDEGASDGWNDGYDRLEYALIGMLYQSELGLIPDHIKIEDMLALVKKVRSE